MSDVTLVLLNEEVNALLTVLGELPTKSNAWPLMLKIKAQVDNAAASAEPPTQEE